VAKIDVLFNELMARKGSDLHLEQGQRPKMRLQGSLKEMKRVDPLTGPFLQELLSEISGPERWHRFNMTGDLDFAYILGNDARFRANYYRHFYGYGAVFRLIPSSILPLSAIDMPEVLREFGNLRSGLVLITGPTGSGKSTTLAALIDHINTNQQKKIITIEEPVEFVHENKKGIVAHREVGVDTASFASGLKSAIKSDADIILVGEMRDKETIALALDAAQMGILVFGTLHTNSATKSVDRIVDVFSADEKSQVRTILVNTLQGVVSQQLLKSVDGSRRWVAYEIMMRTPAIAAIIAEGDTTKLISEIQVNHPKGMILMEERLLELVNAGKVRLEDAFMKASDKRFFTAKIT